MTPNNYYCTLPVYRSLSKQHHRKSYAYGAVYPLYVPADKLISFQFTRPKRTANIVFVHLYSISGNFIEDVTAAIQGAGLTIKQGAQYREDIIVYPGTLPFAPVIRQGQYYLVISDGVDTWYTEVCTLVADVSGYLKLDWRDYKDVRYDFADISNENPTFVNTLYLCAEIGKPDYSFEEVGEDRDGYFFPEKQISEKVHRFVFFAPEFVCDALRFARMADKIRVTKGEDVYECDTFLPTVKWEVQGDLASVECEFTTSTVAKKIGRGFPALRNGDFNNDFNDDYNG